LRQHSLLETRALKTVTATVVKNGTKLKVEAKNDTRKTSKKGLLEESHQLSKTQRKCNKMIDQLLKLNRLINTKTFDF